MKILLLAGSSRRHLYLGYLLQASGNTVCIWTEKKGDALNQNTFSNYEKPLHELHQYGLSYAFEQVTPCFASDKLDHTIYERGIFKSKRLLQMAIDIFHRIWFSSLAQE